MCFKQCFSEFCVLEADSSKSFYNIIISNYTSDISSISYVLKFVLAVKL